MIKWLISNNYNELLPMHYVHVESPEQQINCRLQTMDTIGTGSWSCMQAKDWVLIMNE